MNDFDALLRRVAEEARAAGVPVSRKIDPHVRVNRRAKKRFGCCRRAGDGYVIELSARLLEADERACRGILAHEVLHTCPGCGNHGPCWKAYARRMGEAWGYDIRRTGAWEDLGLGSEEAPARYELTCARCARVFRRSRASSLVLHPERYRCPCGGALVRTK